MVQFQGCQIHPSMYVQSQGSAIICFVTSGTPLLHLHHLAHWLNCNLDSSQAPPTDSGHETGKQNSNWTGKKTEREILG